MLFDYLDSGPNVRRQMSRLKNSTTSPALGVGRECVESVKILDASFSYPETERLILDRVSLTVAQGDFLLITGLSGVGKSTLVDLILGLLRPSSGSIEINGIDSTKFRETNRGSMAYVPQSVSVIDSTIFDNVLFGDFSGSKNEGKVIQALKDVDLWGFVQSLSKGLQTQIGERGTTLSGGQRQRLGIARALYQGASLIVFDESTNALDATTEGFVLDTLSNIRGKATVIIVAHSGGSMGRGHREISISNSKLIEILK